MILYKNHNYNRTAIYNRAQSKNNKNFQNIRLNLKENTCRVINYFFKFEIHNIIKPMTRQSDMSNNKEKKP